MQILPSLSTLVLSSSSNGILTSIHSQYFFKMKFAASIATLCAALAVATPIAAPAANVEDSLSLEQRRELVERLLPDVLSLPLEKRCDPICNYCPPGGPGMCYCQC